MLSAADPWIHWGFGLSSLSFNLFIAVLVSWSWPMRGPPLMAPFLNLFASVVYMQPLKIVAEHTLAKCLCASGIWMFAYMGSEFVLFLQRIALFYPYQPKYQTSLRICTVVYAWSMVLANFSQVVFNSHVIIEIDGHHRFSMLISFPAKLTMPVSFLLGFGCLLFGWLTVYKHLHETRRAAPTSSTAHRYFILLLMCVSATTTLVSATLTSIKNLFAPGSNRVDDFFALFDTLLSVVLASIVFFRIWKRRGRAERSRIAASTAGSHTKRTASSASATSPAAATLEYKGGSTDAVTNTNMVTTSTPATP